MRWIWLTALTVVAIASGVNLFLTLVGHILSPTGDLDTWVAQAFGLMLALYVGAAVLALKSSARPLSRVLIALAIVVIAGVSFVPEHLYQRQRQASRDAQDAENRAFEATYIAGLDTRRHDIEARIAERRPYAGQEALSFVSFVSGANLRYRALGDHSATALALLERALAGKIVDPNAMVRGPTRADTSDEPLFVQFSKFYIRSTTHGKGPPERFKRIDWDIQALLVKYGADLTLPEAAGVADDIQRTAVPDDLTPSYYRLR